MKSPRVSLAALMVAQAQVTFNDCAAKMMLIALVQQLAKASGSDPKPLATLITALLVLPFVLFAPICGWLGDRFSKSKVINGALILQIGAMALLMGALWLRSLEAAIACFFLLSIQTAIFAPAKRGIVVEYAGEAKLSRFVGLMEMSTITAILVGSFAGGVMFSHWLEAHGDPWKSAQVTAWVLGFASIFGWGVFQLAGATEAQTRTPFTSRLLVSHFADVIEVWKNRPLWRATVGICFFYAIGGYVSLLLPQIGFEAEQGGPRSAAVASMMLLMIGVGTLLGNLFAGLFSRKGIELGLVSIGGALLTAVLIALGWATPRTGVYTALLIVAGFSTGLFLVPLYAFIQQKAGNHRRARVLAGVGLLDSVAGLAAYAAYLGIASDDAWAVPVSGQYFLLALASLVMLAWGIRHIPHQTVCTVMRVIGPIFYRVKTLGRENIPAGGALIICNHLSYIDAVVLQLASPRNVRFIAFAGFAQSATMRFLFRALGVIPIAPGRSTRGIRLAAEAIQNGELVCVFPEGAISRTGQLMDLKPGFELISHLAKATVVPAVIDGLWGSIYSFAGNKYLWKSPRLKPTPVCVAFGTPIPPEKVDRTVAREALLDLGEIAFQERPVLRRHLAREVVRSLARRPRHVEVVDRTAERREVKAAQLLAVAAALSRHIRKTIPEKRVGIVLPTGAGAHIANLAVACAGKIPVNLNFTAGKASVEASLRLGEIKTVISADAMRAKIPNFPFPENTLDFKKLVEAVGGKKAIVPWLLAAYILPNQWVPTVLGLPKVGDREEAALLFTSGSSGEPKGVVLTHRNILANCAQISSLSILPDSAVLVACLPVFHSFGFTVTLWYPMLRGCRVVTFPSPLETRKIVEGIQQDKATVLLGAPTFVRPFLKKATKEELVSLNLAVTGAEKLPMDLYESFQRQFGIEILQGYGLTEATPATNINQYDPPITTSTAEAQTGKRTGSVGRLFPGMSARIIDPETGEKLPATSTGIVWLRGANIFPGYLKEPNKTAAAIKDGWFVTGDLGRFDEDGFLFIEGRLSRFSKIGGEMVPHGTVEQQIADIFGLDQSEGVSVAVTGVPDQTKGEALVLLTSTEISAEQLRNKLLGAGLPNLWVPRIVHRVDKIPTLGTGKMDLKGIRDLATSLTNADAGSS